MRFQCKVTGRSSIYLNGRTLKCDVQGCVEVEDSADIYALAGSPEWTKSVQAREPIPAVKDAAPVLRTASDFLDLYQSNDEFRGKMDGLRSQTTRDSFLMQMGFRFTETELKEEIAIREAKKKAPEPPKAPPPPVVDAESPAAHTRVAPAPPKPAAPAKGKKKPAKS